MASEYFTILDRLRWAQRCDPDHEIGKQLRAEVAGHALVDILDIKDRDVKESIRFYEERARSPRYADVRNEIDRMKAAGQKKVEHWYSLWGGPQNVRALAYHLKDGPLYEVLYRSWSKTTHGTGAISRVKAKENGFADADPLRSPSPKEIVDAAQHASICATSSPACWWRNFSRTSAKILIQPRHSRRNTITLCQC